MEFLNKLEYAFDIEFITDIYDKFFLIKCDESPLNTILVMSSFISMNIPFVMLLERREECDFDVPICITCYNIIFAVVDDEVAVLTVVALLIVNCFIIISST